MSTRPLSLSPPNPPTRPTATTPAAPRPPVVNRPVVTTDAARQRLWSLDAFRGATMLLLVSKIDSAVRPIADAFPDSKFWQDAKFHTSHMPWIGASLWDMIQPSFMFMVGVAMAFSYAKREEKGQSYWRMLFHAFLRSILLILLGVFLRSQGSHGGLNWTFDDVVTQIGLGYFFVFLLWKTPTWVKASAVLVVLAIYWGLFAFWPLPSETEATRWLAKDDVKQEVVLTGFEAHWSKNANPAHYFDRWFMNQFPRPLNSEGQRPAFEKSSGGYHTLNFIPAAITMLLGLMAGELLRGPRKPWAKWAILVAAGALLALAGYGLDQAGVCPIVKRIWTPTWTLWSGGVCILILAGFYLLFDLLPLKYLAYPLVVVGANSLLVYCIGWLVTGQILHYWKLVFPGDPDVFHRALAYYDRQATAYFPDYALGQNLEAFVPLAHTIAITLTVWIICAWLYRQRCFIRI
jgi:heparan-alpha-glucosaminide N-acetyltransferase